MASSVSRLTASRVALRSCLECDDGRMVIISAMPTGPGKSCRLYQCDKCRTVEKVTNETRLFGWLGAHLHPPG